MLDWFTIFAVNQVVGAFCKPFLEWLAKELKTLSQEAARDWVKDLLKGVPNNLLTKISISLQQEDISKAVAQVLKEFSQLIQQELEDADLDEIKQREYIQPFKYFIRDKKVKEILGSAFDYNCQSIDTSTLEKIWYELNSINLPTNFDWKRLGKRYLTKVKTIIRDSDKLRAVLDSENIESIKDSVQAIAGINPDFNLIQYQKAIRERYEKLSIDSIETSGYAYNELKLWQIFVEQNVRQVHQVLPQVYELPKEHYKRLVASNQIEAAEIEITCTWNQR